MDSIFSTRTIDSLCERINKINKNSTPIWGKMNAYQMLKHCTESEKINLGEVQLKRLFIGLLFGKMALNTITKNDLPGKKNSPTHPSLVITDHGDCNVQKKALINQIKKYQDTKSQDFKNRVHPFFGKMPINKWDIMIVKHMDHHLRQFGV